MLRQKLRRDQIFCFSCGLLEQSKVTDHSDYDWNILALLRA